MPEGDTVAGHAEQLRPILVGKEIVGLAGTSGSLRSNSSHILGSVVASVRTHGKHLMVDFQGGYTLRVHLGMTGSWRVTGRGGRVPGSARVSMSTDEHEVYCMAAPTVEVERTARIDLDMARLGPDLLSADFDMAEVLRRVRAVGDTPLGELLLDQRVAAGIGNVYKSELAFLARLHPESPSSAITDEQLTAIYEDARRLLAANVGPRSRTTTGDRRRDLDTWVYGRSGARCRRCSAVIASSRSGERITYWCPGCQALAPAPSVDGMVG